MQQITQHTLQTLCTLEPTWLPNNISNDLKPLWKNKNKQLFCLAASQLFVIVFTKRLQIVKKSQYAQITQHTLQMDNLHAGTYLIDKEQLCFWLEPFLKNINKQWSSFLLLFFHIGFKLSEIAVCTDNTTHTPNFQQWTICTLEPTWLPKNLALI